MKVVNLNNEYSVEGCLEVIDRLREAVVDGRVIAFKIAGITKDDAVLSWYASALPVTNLKITGAVAYLLDDCLKQGSS